MADRITDRPVGGEMVGIREIRKVPVVPFALITATIMAIWTLILAIIGLILGAAVLTMVPFPINTGEAATGGIIGIIVSIILVFIGTFIFNAIAAALYNVLAPRMGGIRVELW
ncbi:hypothetical protein [Methanobacterium sp. ACI-7]|uniref:hypothetical protein n=1 Tax=unclassified Methanobacterium TaxID=2627676 RepID=UPI0039C23F5D